MSIPTATYRLQFRDGMTFDRAIGLIPHWKALGISHLYCSPVFAATAGSTHGYDVIDPNLVDPSIGGREGFDRMSDALRSEGLGVILDIVPNHLAASLENPWWWSILEWGQESPYADYFDVDWRQKLTLPVISEPLERELEAGNIGLAIDSARGALAIDLLGSLYPLHPRSYAAALEHADDALSRQIVALAGAAGPSNADRLHAELRDILKSRRSDLEDRLVHRRDPDRMARILALQPWRFILWREASQGLSYRRFFEITGLVGVRVERDEVFDAMHRTVLDMVRRGQVDGLRIDHIDGLADPEAYLGRLRQETGPDTYIVVEKILEGEEQLPPQWPVDGTTGYEFIASLGEVLVDHGQDALDRAYRDVSPQEADAPASLRRAKERMVDHNFRGETEALGRLISGIAAEEDKAAGLSPGELAAALRQLLIGFPVYRIYGSPRGLHAADVHVLDRVFADLHRGADPERSACLRFIHAVLKGDVKSGNAPASRHFRTRLQHLTGPLLAKALEDTFFYRYVRLVALNEVGGDPLARRGSVERFHARMRERASRLPRALNATSTHDTKRGEDARARLYAISEAPRIWSDAVARWRRMHRDAVTHLPDGPAPDPNTEWMLYQSLAGVWPPGLDTRDEAPLSELRDRFLPFLVKALREAKQRTDWMDSNQPYEQAVCRYAERLLFVGNREFLADFSATIEPFVEAGFYNGLTQTLLKLTAPGIPDIYQGCEGLDFSLVDPDNRRAPDFSRLSRGEEGWAGRKRRLIASVLHLRQSHPRLFVEGRYRPLDVHGPLSHHLIAFSREHEGTAALVISMRLVFDLVYNGAIRSPETWRGTSIVLPDALHGMHFSDVLGRATIRLEKGMIAANALFADQPFAMLMAG